MSLHPACPAEPEFRLTVWAADPNTGEHVIVDVAEGTDWGIQDLIDLHDYRMGVQHECGEIVRIQRVRLSRPVAHAAVMLRHLEGQYSEAAALTRVLARMDEPPARAIGPTETGIA